MRWKEIIFRCLELLVSQIQEFVSASISLIQNNPLSFLTFLGIIPTIILGYSSMNHQRRNAARESIEQLDDLYLRSSYKIKPILHEFPKWPGRRSSVKLKIYNPGEVAGVSQPHGNFYIFSREVFSGHSFHTAPDGYIIYLNSANPVEVRNSVETLLDRMGRDRAKGHVDYEEFLKDYQGAYQDEWIPIYDEIVDQLSYFQLTHKNRISPPLHQMGYERSVINCAISDLVTEGVVKECSRNKYCLTADWGDTLCSHFR